MVSGAPKCLITVDNYPSITTNQRFKPGTTTTTPSTTTNERHRLTSIYKYWFDAEATTTPSTTTSSYSQTTTSTADEYWFNDWTTPSTTSDRRYAMTPFPYNPLNQRRKWTTPSPPRNMRYMNKVTVPYKHANWRHKWTTSYTTTRNFRPKVTLPYNPDNFRKYWLTSSTTPSTNSNRRNTVNSSPYNRTNRRHLSTTRYLRYKVTLPYDDTSYWMLNHETTPSTTKD